MRPYVPRRSALRLFLLPFALLCVSLAPARAQSAQADTARPPVLAKEASLLPNPPPGPKRKAARDLSIAGTAAGFIMAGLGVSLVFKGIGEGPDEEGIHRGIALAVSGSLVASVFSAASGYYSRPPGR